MERGKGKQGLLVGMEGSDFQHPVLLMNANCTACPKWKGDL